jgi:hypothetical protein
MTGNASTVLTRRGLFRSGIGLASATVSSSLLANDSTRAEPAARGGAMISPAESSRTIAVEHVKLICRRSFDEVHAALVKGVPQIDPKLASLLVEAKTEEIAAQRAQGPKLWLFVTRDHGHLLAAEGRAAKAYQYEIGNPLTAEQMTGDLAERKRASRTGIGEDDVEGSALGLYRRVESVEVGLIRDRALHRAGVGPKLGHSRVECFLSAAEDEDEGALVDEALCCGAADAGGAAGDHSGLSIQSVHVMHPSFRRQEFSAVQGRSPESPDVGSPKSGGECGITHIGGAKTIHPDDKTPRRSRILRLSVLGWASEAAPSGAGLHHDRLG